MTLTPSLTRHLKHPERFLQIGNVPRADVRASTARFAVFNPSTNDLLAELPDMTVEDVAITIDRAHAAQEGWAGLTARERSDILWRWHQSILENSEDLAVILTAEMGKPLAEARSEVLHAAAYLQWYAEEANRIYGETISAPSNDRRMLVIKQPIGVVGAITPWNFPASMVARKISPALAAGCSVILKPAEQTPLVAGAMFALAGKAGLPEGVLNLVYASEGDAVGRLLMRQCSDQIKRISFELGGNAPFIVFDDADIDAAVDGAIQARFRNAGQTCVSANRVYVRCRTSTQDFTTGYTCPKLQSVDAMGSSLRVEASRNNEERLALIVPGQRRGFPPCEPWLGLPALSPHRKALSAKDSAHRPAARTIPRIRARSVHRARCPPESPVSLADCC
ncbi:aldehyde dehydrogenase family protein [Pararhizobium sp. YC-54]|nr:aldehyde dehydrogenase family protein [Pararhizobium sp. YC-54]